jgi:hypothetical protein
VSLAMTSLDRYEHASAREVFAERTEDSDGCWWFAGDVAGELPTLASPRCWIYPDGHAPPPRLQPSHTRTRGHPRSPRGPPGVAG